MISNLRAIELLKNECSRFLKKITFFETKRIGKPQKSPIFNGSVIKAYIPPPLELNGTAITPPHLNGTALKNIT